MMTSELKEKNKDSEDKGVVRSFFTSLMYSVTWGFLSALVVGCLLAGIWTVIPTALLPWGAHEVNLIGYISHCSYAPISTLILVGASVIGIFLSTRIRGRELLGPIVYAATIIGAASGAAVGFDVVMFIYMGIGVGVGILFGILVGMSKGLRG